MRQLLARARGHERSGELRRAIEAYRKALALQEEAEGTVDLGLQNRLGDLCLRAGDTQAAIAAFERAAREYESQQLYGNAIAVCKKILRNAPDAASVHRRVARLLARSGLTAEAEIHYRAFANGREREGAHEEAAEAYLELTELLPSEGVRLSAADRLLRARRPAEALEQLRRAWQARRSSGEDGEEIRERILAVDPAADPLAAPRGTPSEGEDPPFRDSEHVGRLEDGADERASEGDDVDSLDRDLRRILGDLEGEERVRRALPLLERLIRLEPDRVDLIQRKLSFALTLAEDETAVEAYLALGASLERRIAGFSLRFLTTSSASGGATTAVMIEERPAAVQPG